MDVAQRIEMIMKTSICLLCCIVSTAVFSSCSCEFDQVLGTATIDTESTQSDCTKSVVEITDFYAM